MKKGGKRTIVMGLDKGKEIDLRNFDSQGLGFFQIIDDYQDKTEKLLKKNKQKEINLRNFNSKDFGVFEIIDDYQERLNQKAKCQEEEIIIDLNKVNLNDLRIRPQTLSLLDETKTDSNKPVGLQINCSELEKINQYIKENHDNLLQLAPIRISKRKLQEVSFDFKHSLLFLIKNKKLVCGIKANKSEVLAQLGEGAFGKVQVFQWTFQKGTSLKISPNLSTVKIESVNVDDVKKRGAIQVEREALRRLGRLEGVYFKPNRDCQFSRFNNDKFYTIMEYKAGLTLESYLSNHFDFDEFITIMKDVAKKLTVLHKKNIIHNDLHERNILYDKESKQSSILDFGKSLIIRKGERDVSLALTRFGATYTLAPEVVSLADQELIKAHFKRAKELPIDELMDFKCRLNNAKTSTQADIYALGRLMKRVLENHNQNTSICDQLLNIDPTKRPSAKMVGKIFSEYLRKSKRNLKFRKMKAAILPKKIVSQKLSKK